MDEGWSGERGVTLVFIQKCCYPQCHLTYRSKPTDSAHLVEGHIFGH